MPPTYDYEDYLVKPQLANNQSNNNQSSNSSNNGYNRYNNAYPSYSDYVHPHSIAGPSGGISGETNFARHNSGGGSSNDIYGNRTAAQGSFSRSDSTHTSSEIQPHQSMTNLGAMGRESSGGGREEGSSDSHLASGGGGPILSSGLTSNYRGPLPPSVYHSNINDAVASSQWTSSQIWNLGDGSSDLTRMNLKGHDSNEAATSSTSYNLGNLHQQPHRQQPPYPSTSSMVPGGGGGGGGGVSGHGGGSAGASGSGRSFSYGRPLLPPSSSDPAAMANNGHPEMSNVGQWDDVGGGGGGGGGGSGAGNLSGRSYQQPLYFINPHSSSDSSSALSPMALSYGLDRNGAGGGGGGGNGPFGQNMSQYSEASTLGLASASLDGEKGLYAPYEATTSPEPVRTATRVKAFISKLFHLLSHPDSYGDCIVWDESGLSFIISHANPRLLAEVLPRMFQHSNIHSFTRQLNVYGFNRLSSSELLSKLEVTSTHDFSGWIHPKFRRDDKSTLHTLVPRPSRARMEKKALKEAKRLSVPSATSKDSS